MTVDRQPTGILVRSLDRGPVVRAGASARANDIDSAATATEHSSVGGRRILSLTSLLRIAD